MRNFRPILIFLLLGQMSWAQTAAEVKDATPAVAVAIAEPVAETVPGFTAEQVESLRLQIFLDEEACGPGVLDGKPGWVTRQALGMFYRRNPQLENDPIAFERLVRQRVPTVTATAIIPRNATKYIDATLSNDREEQAKRKDMPYRSLLEFVAERYHTTEDVIIALNGAKVAKAAQPGQALLVPRITPFLIENVSEIKGSEKEGLSQRSVFIDTKERRISIYDYDEANTENQWSLVASFPITPGKPEFIRFGQWKMVNCVPWPDWRFDKKLLETGERGKESLLIPSGPNSPVGVLWAGLSRSGIGIHGTAEPRTIGRSQSAGCIRLANWDIVRLPNYVRPGASVTIR